MRHQSAIAKSCRKTFRKFSKFHITFCSNLILTHPQRNVISHETLIASQSDIQKTKLDLLDCQEKIWALDVVYK